MDDEQVRSEENERYRKIDRTLDELTSDAAESDPPQDGDRARRLSPAESED